MSLVDDPEALPPTVLAELLSRLKEDLEETRGYVAAPKGRVLDPMSLRTARELVDAADALLGRPGPRDVRRQADVANLVYAVMLAAIDLVKSHTDVPRVPRGRAPAAP